MPTTPNSRRFQPSHLKFVPTVRLDPSQVVDKRMEVKTSSRGEVKRPGQGWYEDSPFLYPSAQEGGMVGTALKRSVLKKQRRRR